MAGWAAAAGGGGKSRVGISGLWGDCKDGVGVYELACVCAVQCWVQAARTRWVVVA